MATRMGCSLEPLTSLKWHEVETFIKRFNFYLLAINVTEDVKKKAMFLSNIGADGFNLVCTLLHPRDIEDSGVTYEFVIKALQDHLLSLFIMNVIFSIH